ncbi:hypothetical protein BV22DRAFT_749681 [Leucogyrophana mollusca]|uniref:Uncharacterized protein n=1 Tax=Leucogyrophana mollusca TaxID=85980 RepID=A0ACB8B8C0_9AGAM|nr:hypothetical protein BV22DRAFT_749681 [Leucogyrophana mollusca]
MSPMSAALASFSAELYDLPPSQRNLRLRTFWLSLTPSQRLLLQDEITPDSDSEHPSRSRLTPNDVAFLLRISDSLTWALGALKTSPHKQVVLTAVKLVSRLWVQSSSASNMGDDDMVNGMVELIDSAVPQYVAHLLFRNLSRSRHSRLVDGVLAAIFPFLSRTGSPTPISRYARVALSGSPLILAASRPVLRSVIQHCAAQWFDDTTWRRLARRHPDVIGDILLEHINAPVDIPLGIVAEDPQQLFIALENVIKRPDGDTFATAFLMQYASYTTNHAARSQLKLGGDPTLAALVKYTASLLRIRKRKDPSTIFGVAIAQCTLLAQISAAYGQANWSWSLAQPLIDIALHEFGKSPGEWLLLSVNDALTSPTSTCTGYLLALLRHLEYTNTTAWTDERLWKALRRLPRPARFPLLNLWHIAKTGEDLLDVPATPVLVPKCVPKIIGLLLPKHMKMLLHIGTESWGDDFLGYDVPKVFWGDIGMLDCLRAADAQAPGTVSAGLRAVQVGAARTMLRLPTRKSDTIEVDHSAGELEACKTAIDELKQLASRSRDSRPDFVWAALSLAVLSQGPSLFIDALAWAVNRFAKDPLTSPKLFTWLTGSANGTLIRFLAGPTGVFSCSRTKGMLNVETLQVWCGVTNRAVGILMELLRVWIGEPGHQGTIKVEFAEFRTLLMRLIQKRCDLINIIYPTLIDNIDELQTIMLAPLVELWMQWERMRVVEYPELFAFDNIHNIPCRIEGPHESLKVHQRILPGILPFIEAIGQEREALYLTYRSKFSQPDASMLKERYSQLSRGPHRHFLPFPLAIKESLTSEGILHASGPLWEYVERVLFKDAQRTLDEQADKLDWHPTQFASAVKTFVNLFPGTRISKAHALFSAYNPTRQALDLTTAFILRLPSIQPLLWQDEELCQYIASLLPPYPAENVEPPCGDFDPQALMPPTRRRIPDFEATSPLTVLRNPDLSERDLFQILIPKHGLRGASLRTAHRFAVFAIAFLLTLLGVPRPEGSSVSSSCGVVEYAVHNVRVPRNFMTKCKNYVSGYNNAPAATFPCKLLSFVLPTLSVSELRQLLAVVFAAPASPENRGTQMSILSAVRRLAIPGLGQDEAFQVMQDVSASSWHRQAITIRSITTLRPSDAREYVSRLLSFSQERSMLHKTRVQTDDTTKQGPAIKMSTQKLFIQLLAPLFRRGVLDDTTIMGYAQSGLLEAPDAISSYVVEAVAEIGVTALVIGSRNDNSTWTLLTTFVGIAQRLDERTELSADTWDLARNGSIPMPTISNDRPVATALLSYGGASMAPSIKKLWAQSVVVPILTGHLAARTAWLKCAVARESGPANLQESIMASYCDQVDFSVVERFAEYIPSELWEALENRAVGYLFRDTYEKLHALVAANHSKDWEREPYGKALISLTQFAIKEGVSFYALYRITNTVQDPNISDTGRERALDALLHVGYTMLAHRNMLKPITRPPGRPFATFMNLVRRHLMSARDSRIEHLLWRYLAKAEEQESRLARDRVHGGACYWRVIVSLKLLLARLAAEDCAIGETPSGKKYAGAVAAVATNVVEDGWRHANFPHQYQPFLQCAQIPADEIIIASRELTRPPLCPSEPGPLRSAFLEAAAAVLKANKKEIEKSAVAARALEELTNEWKGDADGALEWLAMAWDE